MSMGADLRDQFDLLINESIKDLQYKQFVEYILHRIAHYSEARTMYAVEDRGVVCHDGVGTAWKIPKAMIAITAFPDNAEILNMSTVTDTDEEKNQ